MRTTLAGRSRPPVGRAADEHGSEPGVVVPLELGRHGRGEGGGGIVGVERDGNRTQERPRHDAEPADVGEGQLRQPAVGGRVDGERSFVRSAGGCDRVVGEHGALRVARRAARGHDEGVARLDLDRPRPRRRRSAVGGGAPAGAGRWAARRRRRPTPAAGPRRTPAPGGRRAATRRATVRFLAPAGVSARLGPVKAWVQGARPRTLPAAVVPVLVGTACAVGERAGGLVWWRAAAAMVVALAIQVATNYANDYSDGKRGTDDPGRRVGPVRLVGWGIKPAASGEAGRDPVLRRRRRGRPRPGRRRRLGAARGRRRELRRRVALHGRPEALRLPRPRRGVRLHLLRPGRHRRLVVRPARGGAGAGRRRRRAGRLPGHRPAGGQQPAGHPRRHRGGQAHPGRPPRRPSHEVPLRRPARRRLRRSCPSWPASAAAPPARWPSPSIFLAQKPLLLVLQGARGADLIPVLEATGRVQLAFGALLATGLALSA